MLCWDIPYHGVKDIIELVLGFGSRRKRRGISADQVDWTSSSHQLQPDKVLDTVREDGSSVKQTVLDGKAHAVFPRLSCNFPLPDEGILSLPDGARI